MVIFATFSIKKGIRAQIRLRVTISAVNDVSLTAKHCQVLNVISITDLFLD